MDPTVFNEAVKPRAAWLDARATATISIGMIAPVAACLHGSTQPAASVDDTAS
jgi:hypothetical protein